MKNKVLLALLAMMLALFVGMAFAAEVEVDEEVQIVKAATYIANQEGDLIISVDYANTGEYIVALVKVQSAPNDVRAFGFDIVYNPEILNYQDVKTSPGDLVENFDQFGTNLIAPGRIRVGGFEAGDDLILTGVNGLVVMFEFNVIKIESCTVSPMKVISQKDHIESWEAVNAHLSIGCGTTGDTNKDGEITPADARCVFNRYLSLPSCLD